jgi:hypothetical protein
MKAMKKVKSICKFLFLFVLFSSYAVYLSGQDDKEARFEKSWKLNHNGKLAFNIYDSDLKVNVWEKSEVKLAGEIIITGGKTDEREKLIEAFKEPEVKSGTNTLGIDAKFWKNSISIGPLNIISLKNGNKVSVRNFKVTYTLWIPENIEFVLKSKYNDIEIADFSGIFSFDLYDADITTGNFGDKSVFNAKYSTLLLGNGMNASFDIYDCKVTGKNLADVDMVSKYSTLEFSTIKSLEIDSYDDDFDIKNLSGIDATAKYTSFLLGGEMGNSRFDLYDSDVKGGSYKTLTFNAKYSELVAGVIGDLNIDAIYDCTFEIGSVDKLTCNESKYDEFYLGTANTSINMPSVYDIQLNVDNLPVTFSKFSGDFKYGSVTLNADPGLDYKLSCQQTYGNLDYPKGRFTDKPLTYIEKNSKIEFESSTDPDASCEINFTAYDLNFTIK